MTSLALFDHIVLQVEVQWHEGSLISSKSRRLCIDPRVTDFNILASLIRVSFDLTMKFSMRYATCKSSQYSPLDNQRDWLLAITKTNPCEPILHVEVNCFGFSTNEWDLISTAEIETSSSSEQAKDNANGHVQDNNRSCNWHSYSYTKPPISKSKMCKMFNKNGNLICSWDKFKLAVYQGGVEPELRPFVWRLLLGIVDYRQSGADRHRQVEEYSKKYLSMRNAMFRILQEPSVSNEIRSIANAVRKDVVRTDRTFPFYAGDENVNRNLISLFNVLTIYALAHPSVGYYQGMSDLAAPILYVLDDESEAYACFCSLMLRMRRYFALEEPLFLKFDHMHLLLEAYEPEFCGYLSEKHTDYLLFCYRWFLLDLKREFEFEDSLMLMEVMWASMSDTDLFFNRVANSSQGAIEKGHNVGESNPAFHPVPLFELNLSTEFANSQILPLSSSCDLNRTSILMNKQETDTNHVRPLEEKPCSSCLPTSKLICSPCRQPGCWSTMPKDISKNDGTQSSHDILFARSCPETVLSRAIHKYLMEFRPVYKSSDDDEKYLTDIPEQPVLAKTQNSTFSTKNKPQIICNTASQHRSYYSCTYPPPKTGVIDQIRLFLLKNGTNSEKTTSSGSSLQFEKLKGFHCAPAYRLKSKSHLKKAHGTRCNLAKSNIVALESDSDDSGIWTAVTTSGGRQGGKISVAHTTSKFGPSFLIPRKGSTTNAHQKHNSVDPYKKSNTNGLDKSLPTNFETETSTHNGSTSVTTTEVCDRFLSSPLPSSTSSSLPIPKLSFSCAMEHSNKPFSNDSHDKALQILPLSHGVTELLVEDEFKYEQVVDYSNPIPFAIEAIVEDSESFPGCLTFRQLNDICTTKLPNKTDVTCKSSFKKTKINTNDYCNSPGVTDDNQSREDVEIPLDVSINQDRPTVIQKTDSLKSSKCEEKNAYANVLRGFPSRRTDTDHCRNECPFSKLPPPDKLGDGNPFVLFVCLVLMSEHSKKIMKLRMDYNEVAQYFDSLIRSNDVRKILKRARKLYAGYLRRFETKT